jgi:DNA polymerase III delta prime subunit
MCQKYTFAGSSKVSIAKKCFEILSKKKIKPKDSKESMIEGVKGIVNSCYPDIRLTINTLQKFSKNGEFFYNDAVKNDSIKESLIKYIKEGKIRNIREEILNSTVDYKLLYDIIFDNIKELTEKQEKIGGIIILVSEYMYRHPTHLNSEINFIACLVEIVNLLKDL